MFWWFFIAQSVKNKYCLFTLKDGTRIKASLPSDDDRDIEDCSLCGEPVFQSYIARRNHVLNKHCMKDLNIDSTEQEVLVPALFLTIKNCFPNARVINDFSCVVCNRIYKTIDTRRDHIGRFHHNGRQFCCVVKGCNYHFTAIFQLRNHFKSCHIGFDKAALNEFLVQEKAVLMQVESHYFPADLAIYKKSIENIYIQVKLIAKSDDTEMHQENDESVSSSIEANESSHENSVTPSNNSPIVIY
uniref:C2H2-type domain-containing protein n=1 Tax=Rhabditophanes sp. KR3021 TaxID=114890 RepID=A0AC35UEY8_9BILA